MSLSTEELMHPRYKVIADYPGNIHPIGHIHGHDINGTQNVMKLDEWLAFHDKYPHLFKKLEWWEDREEKDMPQYVKLVMSNRIQFVHKVEKWNGFNSNGQPLYRTYNRVNCLMTYCLLGLDPATEQEYTEYLTQQTQKV
jgi:hypothetical protein